MSNERSVRKRGIERKVINRRACVLFGIMSICTIGLGARVYNLQTTQYDVQSGIVKNNAIKELYLSPERGDIVDRKGVVLAGTRAVYNLVVIPERITGFRKDRETAIDEFLQTLSKFVTLDDPLSEVGKKISESSTYKNFIVKQDLNNTDLSVVLANIGFIDGISVESKKVRDYPFGDTFLSPIGYVGRVSRDDLQDKKGYNLLSSDYTGKMGLENLYDKSLYGTVGIERVALNSRGRVVERQIAERPKKGSTLQLSIDSELQIAARELMGDQRGAIIMSDVHTGEILVLLSTPSVNPNRFVKGLSKADVKEVFSSSSDMPLYNRAIRGQYPPASIIKPFMAMAGLDGEFITTEQRVWSGPHFKLGGHIFRDWKRQGHGWITLMDAMAVSSDVYFYRLANKMGIEYIHDYLYEYGFGQKTGIDLESEAVGLLPSSAWKRRAKKLPWYGGETITVGIGQGYFMVTPIQMNTAYATLLNGGKKLRPSLIKTDETDVLNELNMNDSHAQDVMRAMKGVIYGKRGTGRRFGRNNVVQIAGKTGTSQVISSHGTLEYKNSEMTEKLRDHAWFSGYAPADDPQVVVTVLVENGSSGSATAAPMAKDLLNRYAKRYLINDK